MFVFFVCRCENIMTCPMREIGSGNEHCPYDWLAVYDGRDDHAPLIGKFCGVGKFPFSIIGNNIASHILYRFLVHQRDHQTPPDNNISFSFPHFILSSTLYSLIL